jgi:hypothetical protein
MALKNKEAAIRHSRLACFAMAFLCAIVSLKAQEGEKKIRIDLLTGPLEISSKNQNENTRIISVRFNQQLLKEIKTGFGDWLDFLAMYSGSNATYIVLRTNSGSGACGPTDVFVLTIYESEYGKTGSRAEVSPILQKCMGDSPSVTFNADQKGRIVVAVSGNELKDDKWVQEKPNGAKK